MTVPSQSDDEVRIARDVRRKVALRILPLIFVLYVVAYLDRANLGFAKLKMMPDLGFSNSVYGWGVGIFFIGYLLLEVPGALIVERWSARKWFARILITWGFCSMGMALVQTETQFYVARFLLGLAEAGFFPGVIVYLTHWFPKRDRARALAGLVFGVPLSLALGAPVSGFFLEQNWFGIAGWKWMFLAEGAPAVLLGLAVPFLLTDRPKQARWLTDNEKKSLCDTLESERAEADAQTASKSQEQEDYEEPPGPMTIGRALKQPTVWMLALGIMAINTGGYALVFWLPTAVKGLLADAGQDVDNHKVLLWTGLVYLCGVVAIGVAAWSSDRLVERRWHCVFGLTLATLGLCLSVVPGQPWLMVFLWLSVAGFGAFFWIPPFWAMPTSTLTTSTAAVAVGVINMCANLAGLFGSPIVGGMKDAGLGDQECLIFLAACYALGAAVIAMVPLPTKSVGSS